MSPATSAAPLNGAPARMYLPIATEMEQVEETFRREMHSSYKYVDELVRYGVMLGGKRLRPALLLLTARAVGEVCPAHITLATVVEMIHTATLVHDDVLDNAATRRHLATVNARWDDEASVLLGDFLFSHAFYMTAAVDAAACRTIGRATNIVCEGELRQKGSRGCFELTEEDYYGIINAKTAELTAVCCELGARYAGASDAVATNMQSYGRELGIAFQIADDLLDFTGEEHETGKTLGTDLQQQKPTLPLIHTLNNTASAAERVAILDLLADQSPVTAILPHLDANGSLEYARQQAIAFADRAIARLESVPASPAKEVLRMLPDFAVRRSH